MHSDLSLSAMASGAASSSFNRTAFFPHSHGLSPWPPHLPSPRRRRAIWMRQIFSGGFNRVPKQFRGENLKEGLKDNFKNTPRYLYVLSDSQMDMFMTEDGLIARQSEKGKHFFCYELSRQWRHVESIWYGRAI